MKNITFRELRFLYEICGIISLCEDGRLKAFITSDGAPYYITKEDDE